MRRSFCFNGGASTKDKMAQVDADSSQSAFVKHERVVRTLRQQTWDCGCSEWNNTARQMQPLISHPAFYSRWGTILIYLMIRYAVLFIGATSLLPLRFTAPHTHKHTLVVSTVLRSIHELHRAASRTSLWSLKMKKTEMMSEMIRRVCFVIRTALSHAYRVFNIK